MADQCALGPDGTLLDASKILFYNDPDDETPLPPVPPAAPGRDRRVTVPASVPGCSHGRPSRARDTTRMKQILQAEKADDDGNVRSRSPTPTKLQNRHASTKKTFLYGLPGLFWNRPSTVMGRPDPYTARVAALTPSAGSVTFLNPPEEREAKTYDV
ncbi:hypothetical protein JOM56_015295 [Amanita muscaria]